jgi:AraC family transcriptional regulator
LYSVKGKSQRILGGQFLLAINYDKCGVETNLKNGIDKGICIDINSSNFANALQDISQLYNIDADNVNSNSILQDELFLKFNASKKFSVYLNGLFQAVKTNNVLRPQDVETEVIDQILVHYKASWHIANKIPVVKASTKAELLYRMQQAKIFIYDNVYNTISIQDIARHVYLSEFRFFHLFKSAYSISPNKLIIKSKMEEAVRLYSTLNYNWTDIAKLLQFPDLQTFSKSFKKYYNLPPTQYS